MNIVQGTRDRMSIARAKTMQVGVGGAASEPVLPTLANLFADFNSNSLAALADNTAIDAWVDGTSSISLEATLTTRPTKQTDTNNGKSFASLLFDNSNDVLATTGSVAHSIGTGDYTVIVVAKVTDTVDGIFLRNGASEPDLYLDTAVPTFWFGGANNFVSSIPSSEWFWILFQRDDATADRVYCYLNGTATSNPFVTRANNWADAVWAVGTNLGGRIARVIVAKSFQDATSISNLDAYMTAKYGIS